MNYGRIRRGPMAADAFTQIRNALFRDKRLSFKDKGVFGLISTHRDGFGISAEAIAACSTDGVSAVKVALRNLERHGYLQRTQQRKPDGTLGASVYFITDQPEAFETVPELENPRSEPSVENPPAGYPPAVEPPSVEPLAAEPPAENHLHKKTNSKKTSGKKTLSPHLPKPRPAEPPAAPNDERETTAAPHNHKTQAQQVAAAWTKARGGRRISSAETEVAQSAAELLVDGWPLDDLIALAEDMAAKYPTGRNLARHADHWQPPKPHQSAAAAPTQTALPAWCEDLDCDQDTRLRTVRDGQGYWRTGPCPDCHPNTQTQEAA